MNSRELALCWKEMGVSPCFPACGGEFKSNPESSAEAASRAESQLPAGKVRSGQVREWFEKEPNTGSPK